MYFLGPRFRRVNPYWPAEDLGQSTSLPLRSWSIKPSLPELLAKHHLDLGSRPIKPSSPKLLANEISLAEGLAASNSFAEPSRPCLRSWRIIESRDSSWILFFFFAFCCFELRAGAFFRSCAWRESEWVHRVLRRGGRRVGPTLRPNIARPDLFRFLVVFLRFFCL